MQVFTGYKRSYAIAITESKNWQNVLFYTRKVIIILETKCRLALYDPSDLPRLSIATSTIAHVFAVLQYLAHFPAKLVSKINRS
jgi:hypothetical protein